MKCVSTRISWQCLFRNLDVKHLVEEQENNLIALREGSCPTYILLHEPMYKFIVKKK